MSKLSSDFSPSDTNSSSKLYLESFDEIARSRYKEKTALIGGNDPHDLPENALSSDSENLPPVRNEDVVGYLVYGTSAYTMGEFKAMKSLLGHKQMTSGWVHDSKVHYPANSPSVLVKAKVNHSQSANETPVKPWIIADSEGKVLAAHCTCVAGLGETYCHVAAVLFTIDTANRIHELRTVTDGLPYWGQPSFKKVAYNSVESIDFTSAASRKRQLDAALEDIQPRPDVPKVQHDIEPTTQHELERFFWTISCKNSGVKPVVLSIKPDYSDDYVVKTETSAPILTHLFDENLKNLSFVQLLELGEKMIAEEKFQINDEVCITVESKTREQAKCHLWHQLRAGRVTASLLHQICHTDPEKPSLSLLRKVCRPQKSTRQTKATKWGTDHENKCLKML